ncbi:MAG TPA: hypothetical protein VMS08_05460 [Candidatus Saccharimonadia bacterium]|nr:hypothetical protein [Candidatus Saccharimonadia bacterium]
MTGISSKKLIGTAAIVFVLAVGAFGTAKAAQAFFLAGGSSLIFDGTVGTVGTASVTVYTTSTTPVLVEVTPTTVFDGGTRLSGLAPGDQLKIIAVRRGGILVGQVIKVESGVSGYGTTGDTVLVSPAVVVSTGSSSFVVRSNGIDITFNVSSATRFFNTSLGQLVPGERLVVIGEDTGSSATGFVAQDVFR